MAKKVFIIILVWVVIAALNATASTQWYKGTFRVNTDVSAGDESIETVLEKASKAGLKFILFSDQFLVRCEYGLPPFRNIFKIGKEQKSIVTYGINNYLRRIVDAGKKYPEIITISGADIAPCYYWTGSFLKGTLTVNQYSEQLTVFGNDNADFYRNLPVIHNERYSFALLKILSGLSTLLLTLAGLFIFFNKKPYYGDAQGNLYYRKNKLLKITCLISALTGILWTINNKPLKNELGFDAYHPSGAYPFQKVIDYVSSNGGGNTGIIWSAPEITMKGKIGNISLVTVPYLKDIENTDGYNGFAGIYGDVSHAHEPGKLWDKLLWEYCSGKRKIKPVIIGESDYHGRSPIDMIQTVVHIEKLDKKNVMDALLRGYSYAVAKNGEREIIIKHISLNSDTNSAGLGETLKPFSAKGYTSADGKTSHGEDENHTLILNISGKMAGITENEKCDGEIVIVANGKKVFSNIIQLNDFSLKEKILVEDDLQNQYVRFYIKTMSSGYLLANPIFIERTY